MPWYNHGTVTIPSPLTRWTRMFTALSRDWSIFQQIFAEHWEAFQYTTWKVSCNLLNLRKQFTEGFFSAVFVSP
jgi:hypothetical protein